MRKLLNTLYITNEKAYLTLDGENIVCKIEDEDNFRIPFDNVESIVCFSFLGCSPAFMGKCVEKCIPLSFISPFGKYLASVSGGTHGNVFMRVSQIDVFREKELELAKKQIAAKITNSISVIRRSKHDIEALREDADIQSAIEYLKSEIESIKVADSIETILGIEGNCAKKYFSVFGKLITNNRFYFNNRTKRPPLDPVNAILSFVYTLYVSEYASALETVGIDSYIGFYHRLRSGRKSLACDLVEETRCIAERFSLTLVNLGILSPDDFDYQPSGAVFLNIDGRKKVITKWQEKKRSDFNHPYLQQKIQFGLLPYVQANLLAKYIRGEIPEYPCYIVK
ncbi:MAG: CRISPR-associated endonuclease Cas1 [Clostridia bacterium]|nr:CRISPR-associated endonuclease Cas1 [Clostridia bacterium]